MTGVMRVMRYNWHLKLVALGAGIALWAVHVMGHNRWKYEPFDATVEARGVPEGLQVMAVAPPTVRVWLAGRSRNLARVQADGVRATVYVGDRDVGKHEVPVSVATGSLPRGVSVHQAPARTVVITLDRSVEQKRPVTIDPRGEPAPGFKIIDTRVRPNQVTVRGPQRLVHSVESAVAVVFASGIRETQTFVCRLEARDAYNVRVEGVTMDPPEAEVEYTVERLNTKQVPLVIGDALSLPRGWTLDSFDVDVPVLTITGKPEVLRDIDSVKIRPVEAPRGATELTAQFDLPEGVKAVDADSVHLTLRMSPPPRSRRPEPTPAPPEPGPSGNGGTAEPPTEPTGTPVAPHGEDEGTEPEGPAGPGGRDEGQPEADRDAPGRATRPSRPPAD